eukprot:809281-Alexandrium_andersonii.AAC.1
MIVTGGIGRLPNCLEEGIERAEPMHVRTSGPLQLAAARKFRHTRNSTAMHPEPNANELIRARKG